MAKFTTPGLVSETIWNLRLADLPRGTNRGLINGLVNGNPPYTEQEREANNIEINCNFLDATQLCADARRSLYNAFQAPGKFFTVTFDSGPVFKRQQWGREITNAINRIMKGSRLYAECLDSQIAATVLHSRGPAVWPDRDKWCPEEKGIEDVLIPGDTLRSLRNLDYFAVFYQYTPEQLWAQTHGARRDPAWNMPMVDAAIKWAQSQTMSQTSYSDLFSPEKVEERFKQDLGFFGTDAVPTIDFWKFFYHEDKGNESGWRMRGIIDTPGDWEVSGLRRSKRIDRRMPKENLIGEDHNWLYNPGDRLYASNIEELIHFQFGDLSAVSPFRIHSGRGLGWLLYAICHLQNRLLCKFNEAVFENLMQYFRGNEQDKTRVQKVDLHHFGFVPDGVAFVRPEERWQVNSPLIEQAIDRNRQRMEYSAAQYRQGQQQGAASKEKTATEIMAEVNSAMAMVGSLLTQAYRYQGYQYNEICRRFCRKDSKDMDARKFQAQMKAKNVPDEMLNVERWNIEPEKVMGSGNKTLQIAMADALMQLYPYLDPDAQRIVLRINAATKSDNDDLANRLVPELRSVSGSAHDAANGFGTLMLGAPVPVAPGANHPDSIEVLMADMAAVMQQIAQRGMPTMQEIIGLRNVAMHIAQNHVKPLSQDKSARQRVKGYMKELAQLMKQLQVWTQQMAKAQQAQAQNLGGNGGMDPKDQAKIAATMMMAKAKAQNTRESHAERTAQKQIAWEKEQMRKDKEQQFDLRRKMHETRIDTTAKDLVTAAEVRRGRLKSLNEGKDNT